MGVIFPPHSKSLECAQLQPKPRHCGFYLTPMLRLFFLFFGTRCWLDHSMQSKVWRVSPPQPKQKTPHTVIFLHQKLDWKPFSFLFFPPSPLVLPSQKPNLLLSLPPPASPPRAPGLACILGLGIHMSRPIDLLSFFKVRSWNLTQWGMEGQNQPITYRVGRGGREWSYPRGKEKEREKRGP